MEKTTYFLTRSGTPENMVCLDEKFYLRYRHKRHTAEFALYSYLEWRLSSGEEKVDVDIPTFVDETGYSRTSVYRALSNLIEDGVVEERGRNRERWLILMHGNKSHNGTQSQDGTESQNGTNSRKSNKDNNLRPSKSQDSEESGPLFDEYTKYMRRITIKCNDTNKSDTNTYDNDTIKSIRNPNIFDTLLNNEENQACEDPEIRKIQEEIEKVREAFSHNEEVMQKNLKPLIKRLKGVVRRLEQKEVSGYRAKDYGASEGLVDDSRSFIKYYMTNVYKRRNVDFYIPKSNYGKYIARSAAVVEELGPEKSKLFIDWFLRQDNLAKTGYSLDLLISASMMNQFLSADPKETRVGFSSGFISNVEDAKEASNKAKRF